MNYFAIVLITLMASSAFAKKLNLKPGHYKLNTTIIKDGKETSMNDELQDVMKQMQESLKGMDLSMLPPEAQKQMREQVKSAEAGQIPGLMNDVCLYAEDLSIDSNTIAEKMGNQDEDRADDCKLTVVKSSASEILTKNKCSDGVEERFHLKVLSPTKFVQEIAEVRAGGKKDNVMKVQASFVSGKCPAEIVKRDKKMQDLSKKLNTRPDAAPSKAPKAPSKKTKTPAKPKKN